jgi:hypothetical protein
LLSSIPRGVVLAAALLAAPCAAADGVAGAVAGMVASAGDSHTTSAAPAPWFGTWQLNPGKSTRRPEPSPYRRVTSRIEPLNDGSDDGVKVTYRMVGTRGGVTHMEWTGRFDGKDYPVQGSDNVLTNAYRRVDERSYQIIVKADGQLAATAMVRVSRDGKTMTVTTAERGPAGKTVDTTAVYEKR